jgi:hypothetical protein
MIWPKLSELTRREVQEAGRSLDYKALVPAVRHKHLCKRSANQIISTNVTRRNEIAYGLGNLQHNEFSFVYLHNDRERQRTVEERILRAQSADDGYGACLIRAFGVNFQVRDGGRRQGRYETQYYWIKFPQHPVLLRG